MGAKLQAINYVSKTSLYHAQMFMDNGGKMQKPKWIVIKLNELAETIKSNACSGYACYDLGWNCNVVGFHQGGGCDTYDNSKCDPLAPINAVHGSFN